MSALVYNLWGDLRAKRLWPVAAVLVLAIIAAPVVLKKSAEAVPAKPTQPAAVAPKADPLAALMATQGFDTSSDLDRFTSKNPFKSLARVAKIPAPSTLGAGASSPPSTGGPSGGAVGGSTAGGGIGSGSDGSTGSGSGGSTAPEAKPKATAYTYTADVTFSTGDKKNRVVKSLSRLEMLPDSKTPLLVFLGVDATGRKAVFLVDQDLEQTGEGSCKPSRDTCSFLYLADSEDKDEHSFTDQAGNEYSLKLNDIKKTAVRAQSSSRPRAKTGRASSREKTGSKQVRAFVPPLFAELFYPGSAPPTPDG